MFFRRRRERRIRELIRPYIGSDSIAWVQKERAETELICVVLRLHDFESMVANLSLRDLGEQMNRFYGAAADALMRVDGDVNRFSADSVVVHFNVLHRVEESQIIEGAMNAFKNANSELDPKLGARIGAGICRGMAIAGMLGSQHRYDFTALGPSAICAHHLAKKSASLNICEEFAEHFSRPQIPKEPWISIEKHWNIEA